MFQRLKKFHEKTMELYQQGLEEEMEPWKKKVLDIHKNAVFLFYADELDLDSGHACCIIRGELVKGRRKEGDSVLILNGEGTEIAKAIVRTEATEKEDMRKGLLKRKRNEFRLKIVSFKNKEVDAMDEMAYGSFFRSLSMEMSLIMEDSPEKNS